jgi:glycosyltransferase involved in cell wall biosynthesis
MDIDLIVPRKWRGVRFWRSDFQDRIRHFYALDDLRITGLYHLPLAPFKLDKLTHGLLAPLWAGLRGYDIVYTRNSLPAWISYWLGKKVVFEIYRLYDQTRRNGAVRLATLTRRSQSLILITHSAISRDSIVAAGADQAKVRVIPNGYNPAVLAPGLTTAAARDQLGWAADEKIVCFAGRIAISKGAEAILQLADLAPDIKFVLIGDVEDGDRRFADTVRRRGLANIRQMPWVRPGDLAPYLFAADVLLIPPTAAPLTRYGTTVLPIKTFVYLGAGKPILAPDLPDLRGVLSERNAVLVEPDNPTAAANALRRVFESPDLARSIADQARSDSRKYTWRRRARRIEDFLSEELLS